MTAPDVRERLLAQVARTEMGYAERFEHDAERFYRETGWLAPGKSVPMELWSEDADAKREAAWVKFGEQMKAEFVALMREAAALALGLSGVVDAVKASTARIYPDEGYERYLDEIVGSTVDMLDELTDEHAAACVRQLTEALHALRRSRDELRTDAVRLALAIRKLSD